MPQLNGKSAIITGSASGVGLETARVFLREGANVLLFDIRGAKLREAAASLGSTAVEYLRGDIASQAKVRSAVEAAVEAFGSKAALNMLSRVFAMENAEHGVRVNLVLPGSIEGTDFVPSVLPKDANLDDFYGTLAKTHPLGRNTRPADVTEAILFLASDSSKFITGTCLNVDGGRHMATNRPTTAFPHAAE